MDLDPAKIRFLIQRGAKINDQPGGGSSILDRCLSAQGGGNYYGLRSYHERADRAFALAEELIAGGARWLPSAEDVRHARLWLRHADSSRCVEVAKLLLKNDATPRDVVGKLFGTRAMRKRLGSSFEEIRALTGSPGTQAEI